MDNRFDFDTPHYESPEQEQADILSWLADDDAQEKQRELADALDERVSGQVERIKSMNVESVLSWLADEGAQEEQRKRIAAIKVKVDEAVKTIRSMRLESGERDLIEDFMGVTLIEYVNAMRALDYRLYATFSDEGHPFRCDDQRHQPIATKHVNNAIVEACKRLECFKKNGTMNKEKLAQAIEISKQKLNDLIERPETVGIEVADKLCRAAGRMTYDELLGISDKDTLGDDGPSAEYLLGVDVMEPEDVLKLYMMADDRTRRIVTMTLQKELALQLCANREC